MGSKACGSSPNTRLSLCVDTCALTSASNAGHDDRPPNEYHIAAVWQEHVEEKCFLSDTRLSSYQNRESMICPQEVFKTNLVRLDDVPLLLAGQKTVPVLAARDITHQLDFILPGAIENSSVYMRTEKLPQKRSQDVWRLKLKPSELNN